MYLVHGTETDTWAYIHTHISNKNVKGKRHVGIYTYLEQERERKQTWGYIHIYIMSNKNVNGKRHVGIYIHTSIKNVNKWGYTEPEYTFPLLLRNLNPELLP
jgi:hypothetical protein